jgi:Sigma-70, region 4
LDSFSGVDVASPGWRFGDAGRPFLGNRSYLQLAQMAEPNQRIVLHALIKRFGKKQALPDGRVTRVSLQQVGDDVAEILGGGEFNRGDSLGQASFYVDHLDSTWLIEDLSLRNATVKTLVKIGLDESDSVTKLGGLLWREILDGGGDWLQILEIAHTLYDWFPWLLESELATSDSDSLDVLVYKLTTLACSRNDMEPMEIVIWAGFLAARFGWGVEKLTLDEIGARAGITRERVRQIQVKLSANLDFSDYRLPKLLEEILAHNVEDPNDDICDSLRRDGFSIGKTWSWPGLFELYKVLGHGDRAEQWYSTNGMTGTVLEGRRSIDASIKSARAVMGIVKMDSVKDLADDSLIPEEVVRQRIPELYTTYAIAENYAVVSSIGSSSVLTETSKQLGVASPLSIDVIYKGLMQVAVYRHSQAVMPPARILKPILLDSGFSQTAEGLIYGPTKELAKAAILRAAIPLGISMNTLNIYLSYASWVRLIGNGIYSLVGVNPTSADVQFAERVEAAIAVPNSHADFTVSPSGQEIFVTALFSTPFLVNGVLSVGRQLAQLLGDTKRGIHCCDAIELDGKADVKQGAVHGFATLRQHLVQDHNYQEGMSMAFRVTATTFAMIH